MRPSFLTPTVATLIALGGLPIPAQDAPSATLPLRTAVARFLWASAQPRVSITHDAAILL